MVAILIGTLIFFGLFVGSAVFTGNKACEGVDDESTRQDYRKLIFNQTCLGTQLYGSFLHVVDVDQCLHAPNVPADQART